jgi:hypothetical protein
MFPCFRLIAAEFARSHHAFPRSKALEHGHCRGRTSSTGIQYSAVFAVYTAELLLATTDPLPCVLADTAVTAMIEDVCRVPERAGHGRLSAVCFRAGTTE